MVGSIRGPQELHSERARFQRRSEVPTPSNTKAATLTGTQFRHLLRVTEATSFAPECVFLTHDDTRQELDAYIEWRWAKCFGTEQDRRRYRGLSPATPLIVTRRGEGFAPNRKPCTPVGSVVEDYWDCDALQSHVSELYRAAGLAECSSHTGWRTFANRVLTKCHAPEVIQPLLGHADLDHADAYLDVKAEVLDVSTHPA